MALKRKASSSPVRPGRLQAGHGADVSRGYPAQLETALGPSLITSTAKGSQRKSNNQIDLASRMEKEVKVSVRSPELLAVLFEWMAERDRIFNRRSGNLPLPWTHDKVLAAFPFCNTFRLQDRNSQYLLQRVLTAGPQDLSEIFFRATLFRLFNKVATWEALVVRLGRIPTWKDFNISKYAEILEDIAQDATLYTGAYQVSSSEALGHNDKLYRRHLRFLHVVMSTDLHTRIASCRYLEDAFYLIRQYPGAGDFSAHQLALDYNLIDGISYSEDEWVCAGPGATACLKKIFGDDVAGYETEAILHLVSIQHEHWRRIGYTPRLAPDFHRIGVSPVDIEHALCEVEKYSRVAMKWIPTHRSQIKKSYSGKGRQPLAAFVLPTKWKNGKTGLEGRVTDKEMAAKQMATEDGVYEVSHIVCEGKRKGTLRLRWTNYPPRDDTDEPRIELVNTAPECLDDWDSFIQDIAKAVRVAVKL